MNLIKSILKLAKPSTIYNVSVEMNMDPALEEVPEKSIPAKTDHYSHPYVK